MGTGFTPRVSSARKPMRVRFFHDRDLSALESVLNEWLAERPDREIAEIRQSVSTDPDGGSHFVVSVWYIEG